MHWRLVECDVCGVVFASPAPSAELLTAAYRDASYDSRAEAVYAAATYGRLVRRLLPRLPATGGALDVGAGDGAFLEVLRALGFGGVEGVEPSRAAVDAADSSVRPLIREGVFSSSDFDLDSFRFVSCLQTVEHLPNPLELFGDAHALLRSDGALLVVCHDRTAPVNRLLGRRSPIYDVEHLQLLHPRSLRGLLERAGFDDIEIRPFANRYPLRYWMRLAPLPARAKNPSSARWTACASARGRLRCRSATSRPWAGNARNPHRRRVAVKMYCAHATLRTPGSASSSGSMRLAARA